MTSKHKTRFPIGFWNYVPIDRAEEIDVKDWEDAGITLTMGPECGPGREAVEEMTRILDDAAECNIRVIACDRRTHWRNLTAKGEETYRAESKDAIRDFGKHPALFGFSIGDEPDHKEFADACKAMRIQKELAPGLTPFCNLLPWYKGVDDRVGFSKWSEYLDEYVKRSGTEFFCYDCYAQMNPLPDCLEGEWGWDMYFANLREFHAASQRHKMPFWNTILSVGHFRYRSPTENDLRWQLNTSLAHGAKGILYFFFYQRQPHDNYRLAPIDEHWDRTETYSWLSRVNRSFLKGPAPVVQELTLEKVWHVGRAWGGNPLIDLAKGPVQEVKASGDVSVIVSEFRHSNGSPYIMVVNNSQTQNTQVTLTVRGKKPTLHHVGWNAVEVPAVSGDGWKVQNTDKAVTVRPWLSPGQMELYRLESLAK